MQIDVTTPLLGIEGEEVKQGENEILRARSVIINSLMMGDMSKLTGEEKVQRAELARRIFNDDTVVLKAEEAALIKKTVGEIQPPLAVEQIWSLLDE